MGGQSAAPQGLHDDYGNFLLMGVLQAFFSRLRVFVHIIVLNLAKIPVVGVDERFKGFRVAVERKAYIANRAGALFFRNPLVNAEAFQAVPDLYVKQHVHQIKINMISFQASELFLKKLFYGRSVF